MIDDPDDFMPEYPPTDVEVTEDMMDQANDKRSQAQAAMSDGRFGDQVHGFVVTFNFGNSLNQVCLSVCLSITLSCPLYIFWTPGGIYK